MNTDQPRGNSGGESAGGGMAQTAGNLASMATHQVGDTINRNKAKLMEMQTALAEKTRECARNTDMYVHENPWQAVGMAAGIGLILGLLMRR